MRIHTHMTANEEALEPFPFRRELSMESYLVENPSVLSLDNDNYSDVVIVQEELTLKQGRSSKDTDGRIDVLLTYSSEIIGIVELKLGEINDEHLVQLEDYLKQKDQIFEKDLPEIIDLSASPNPKWVGVIVGSSISASLAAKISSGYQIDGIPIAALTIQRFKSSLGNVYISTNVIFKVANNAKDNTKYRFANKNYGKGRLVQAVVRQYCEDNPATTFSHLIKVFPNNLQGTLGVVSSKTAAEDILANTGRARHFVKPTDFIEIQDETVAVSSQWGIGNIDRFISAMNEIGYPVTPV
jgi:hypothetical protein